MSRHFESERIDVLRTLSGKRLSFVVRNIVDELSSERATRSGMEQGLVSFWDEFAAQIAVEQSDLFEVYQEYVQNVCMAAAKKLPAFDLHIMALFSDAFVEWWLDRAQDGGGAPDNDEAVEWVAYDLYALVLGAAEAEVTQFRGRHSDA